jgi:hypothetical protein
MNSNSYEYEYTAKSGQKVSIEVFHRGDGFFMAIPVNKTTGRRARLNKSRTAMAPVSALKEVIEVIETTKPTDLFSEN